MLLLDDHLIALLARKHKMCRYAQYGPYKLHYACFACRKVFRQLHESEVPAHLRLGHGQERVVCCPECKQLMHDMGYDFKAPPTKAKEQWQVIEQLHAHGITFHSCGCSGPGYRPTKLRDLKSFLEHAVSKTPGEQLLARWRKASTK